MSPLTRAFPAFFLSLALAAAIGCVNSNDQSVWDPVTGHAENWVQTHGASYEASRVECVKCHGDDLRGGISKVSCYSSSFEGTSCHAGGPGAIGHGSGWGTGNQHGAAAKTNPGATAGFAYCAVCHGSDFAGGTSGTSCFTCHGVSAPHPPTPWRGGTYTHFTTGTGNAAVCAGCHRRAAGTPGCYNNTLCHGVVGTHPAGWDAGTVHGPSAKAAPGSSSGFAYCEVCHGAGFTGGTTGTSCFGCHGVSAPHPPEPWLGTYTHTNVNTGNLPVCANCHRSASGTPGCFNATLCHAHQSDWSTPSVHGGSAKQAPGVSTGFSSCQPCHGSLFSGGTSGTACYGCHGVSAPHPPKPWIAGTYTHTSANTLNAEVCGLCHRKAAATGPSQCFNDTLCHAGV